MRDDLIVAKLDEMSREDWLASRRNGIGASDSAAILGWSPWSSPWATWLDKVGAVPVDSGEQTESMYFGTLLEGAIAEAFEDRTGCEMSDPKATYRHPVHEWMLASPDRFIYDEHHDGVGILECKNTSAYNADEWKGAQPDADGVLRGGEAPLHYIIQVQHQHAVLGTTWGYLVALLGGNTLCIVEVDRDDELIAMLTAALEGFWHDHVLANVPPPMDGQDTTTELLTKLFAESDPDSTVELEPEVAQAILDYRDALELENEAKEAKTLAGNVLRERLGEAEAGEFAGQTVVTWKASPVTRLDTKALRAEDPETFAKYERTTVQRTLRPGSSKAAREALSQLTEGRD